MLKIPKKIHYCWFGGKPLPRKYEEYMKTWIEAFADYEIIKWDESNFPIDQFEYAKQAMQEGKMAFVSDVARIYALYEYGGIYFDTDVEVLHKFKDLLEDHGAVLGVEDEGKTIGTGFMAFKPHHEICALMLDYYKNNSYLTQSKTMSNTFILANIIRDNFGVEPLEKVQVFDDVVIFPSSYFTAYRDGMTYITDNTRCVHHFGASWHSPIRKLKDKTKVYINRALKK